MTGAEALSAYEFAEKLAEELAGGPLPPEQAAQVRRRVGEWVAPLLDWEARMGILVRTDQLDLLAGKAILLENGTVWRGDDVHGG